MDLLLVLILAAVQGVAEFLPISSSGHLAVLGTLFGFDPEANLALGIVLHAGTLLAILVFYCRRLAAFLRPERFHLAGMVVLASLPAAAVGIVLKKSDLVEPLFNNLLIVGCGWIATGAMLQFSERRRARLDDAAATPVEKISWRDALLIGGAQAVAVLPGISRSGSTIAAALLRRVRTADCAEFSFLLAIPAIGGASLLELIDLLRDGAAVKGISVGLLSAGFLTSAVIGYASLALLVRLLNRGRLAFFAWYLYGIGAATVVWQLAVRLN